MLFFAQTSMSASKEIKRAASALSASICQDLISVCVHVGMEAILTTACARPRKSNAPTTTTARPTKNASSRESVFVLLRSILILTMETFVKVCNDFSISF